MKNTKFLLSALLIAAVIGSLADLAVAKKKETPKPKARVSYSGNFVGELEPCG